MRDTAPSLRPAALLGLIIGFLVIRAALFAVTTAGEFALYRYYAVQARATSFADLHRDLDIEYPPLATLFGIGVLHVADHLPDGIERLTALRPESTLGEEYARYEVALGLVLFLVDVACLLLVHLIARRIYPDDPPSIHLARLWLYVAATTALGLIMYDRQDLVVGFVALLALAAFARGWRVAAYAILAAGVAYKLVPLLLVPFWVVAFAVLRTVSPTLARFALSIVRESLIAGLFLALVPILMYVFCGGERAFVFLSFHSARGLQLECSAACPVLLMDPSTVVGHGFGSHTLYGELSDRVARLTTPITVFSAVLSFLLAMRGFRRAALMGPRPNELAAHLVACSLLVWIGFILCTKVGSPQYPLWIAPLLPLVPFRGREWRWVAVALAACMVTTLIFPCQYLQVRGWVIDEKSWTGPTPFGFVLLAAKSLLFATAFVWLAALVWRARWVSTVAGLSDPG
jgi:hypothetical protein